MDKKICPICQKEKYPNEIISGVIVRPEVAELIKIDFPKWNEQGHICKTDINRLVSIVNGSSSFGYPPE